MRVFPSIFAAGLCAVLTLANAQLGLGDDPPAMPDPDLPRALDSLPFGPGETATFELGYGVIKAGEATISVEGLVEYFGQTSIHLRTRARSNTFFDAFYKVRDQADSYADADSLFARYYSKHLREGGYERDVEIHFDQINGVAYYPDGRESAAPLGTHDILTAFFRVRTLPLQVGDTLQLTAHGDKRLYTLDVRVLREERIDTIFGRTDCIVVQPVLTEEGLFNHSGELLVWFTNDARRIPVLMRASVPVGAIEARLTRYVPGGRWE